MFVTIINDCRDQNALGRQATRAASLFNCPVIPIGVQNDLEAAGTIVDTLDAAEGREGIVLANVAPRNGKARQWGNGSPFGYFYYKSTLVVTSIDGVALSLVKKLGIADCVRLLDIPSVLALLREKGEILEELEERVASTQFRSFEFLPRIANWLCRNEEFPTLEHALGDALTVPRVWFIDSFGNAKTTLLSDEKLFIQGERVKTQFGELTFYPRLKDVPDDERALVVGSSGIEKKRFCEIVIQGKSAAQELGISVGDVIF